MNDALSETMKEEALNFHKVMRLLRAVRMEHGLCQPRSRRACTHCNAQEELDYMVEEYKGQRIVAQG